MKAERTGLFRYKWIGVYLQLFSLTRCVTKVIFTFLIVLPIWFIFQVVLIKESNAGS